MLRSLDFLSSRDSSTSFQHEGFAHAGKVLWLAPPQTAELISILESWELFPDLWPAPPASGLSLILICFLLSFCQSVWVPCFSVFTISGLESKPREMKDTFRGNENSFLFNMRALSWVVFTTYLLKRWVFNWMYKWVNPPVVLPLMCRIKGHRFRDGQWWPVFFFFFFMDEQDMPGQLQGAGVKGQRLWQQGFWVSERWIITHHLWSMCLCDPSPWFSCWSSKRQCNPTWKCHCIDYLRCGTAHSGDVGRMAEAKVSRQAAWLAGCCVISLLALLLFSHSFL